MNAGAAPENEKPATSKDPGEALAQRIVDAAPIILGVVDLEAARLVAHNRALDRALAEIDEGPSGGDLAALRSHVHPADRAALAGHVERLKAAQDDEAVTFDLRMRTRTNQERVFALRCVPFKRHEDGQVREALISAHEVSDARRKDAELRQTETLFAAFREHMPALMYAKDGQGVYLLTSPAMDNFLGVPPGGMQGRTDADFFPPEVVAAFQQADQEVREAPAPIEREEPTPNRDGGITHFYSVKFPVRGPGIPEGTIAGISIDLTRAKVAEAEREAAIAKEALIAAQQETIRLLATPLMPIADGVLVMPIIGTIDTERANRIMDTLLEGISHNRASIAIIDVTGVKTIDTQVAEALLRAARAVRLLGASVVLTGISPPVAQTLVELGIDWQNVAIEGTLRDGIDHALRSRPTTRSRPSR